MLLLRTHKVWVQKVIHVRTIYNHKRIGNRDVVGHGPNGIYAYKDDAHFPFPAVRFKENDQYYLSLKIKEKGDWKQLTCKEKKELYRGSFCQTFAEFQFPTGAWMFCLGWALIVVSVAIWLFIYYDQYITDVKPKSLDPKNKTAQLRRMIDLHVNPIDGLASHWNYKDDCWRWQQDE